MRFVMVVMLSFLLLSPAASAATEVEIQPQAGHGQDEAQRAVSYSASWATHAATSSVDVRSVRLVGHPADMLGGISGQVLRSAQCPVIVVPRGIEALFPAATTAA